MRLDRSPASLVVIVWLALVTACDDFRLCDTPRSALAKLPERLSETGLYSDLSRAVLADAVRPYAPRFQLWSDGATKRRFIALPAEPIDTRDMDDWQFPEGTRLWKEFTREGVRVETRLAQKLGPAPADWAFIAYVWNDDQTEAFASIDGEQNAGGTPHDVPRAADCMGCHAGRKSRVLGFSAVQLPQSADGEALSLDALIAAGSLSDPPPEAIQVPGDAVQVAGLGYLHANCSHCHNATRPEVDGPRCYDPEKRYDFALRVGELARVEDTAAVRSAVGRALRPERADRSKVLERMRVRDPDLPSMPPLGTEQVDRAGVEVVRAFIASLGAPP